MLSKELLGLCHFSGTNMCSFENGYVPVYAKFSENWKMKTEKTENWWYFLKDVVNTWILVTKIVGGSYGKTAEIVKRTFSWLKNAKSQAPLEHF